MDDASKNQLGVEVSANLIFAAFEKFLKRAWQDQFGPVVNLTMLQTLQEKSGETLKYVSLYDIIAKETPRLPTPYRI